MPEGRRPRRTEAFAVDSRRDLDGPGDPSPVAGGIGGGDRQSDGGRPPDPRALRLQRQPALTAKPERLRRQPDRVTGMPAPLRTAQPDRELRRLARSEGEPEALQERATRHL